MSGGSCLTVIFGNTDRSDNAVCPLGEASMIVGCCFVTVNVRVRMVGEAVEVICMGSRSTGSVLTCSVFITDVMGVFLVRSRALLLIRNSQSKSEKIILNHYIVFLILENGVSKADNNVNEMLSSVFMEIARRTSTVLNP